MRAVAVDVTGADAVAVAVIADDVLDPRAVLQIEPGERRGGPVELRQELARLAVVVEIDELRELGREPLVDLGRPSTRRRSLPGFFSQMMLFEK